MAKKKINKVLEENHFNIVDSTKDAMKVLAEAADKAVYKLEVSAQKAVDLLASATDKATATLASAAKDATTLLASNASEAVKVSNVKNEGDHDLLIRLEENMKGLKADIKDLKDGTNDKIADHEIRLGALESSKTRQNVMMSIGIGLLTLLVSLLLVHLFKI